MALWSAATITPNNNKVLQNHLGLQKKSVWMLQPYSDPGIYIYCNI